MTLEDTIPEVITEETQLSHTLTKEDSFLYNETITRLHIVLDTLSPVTRYDNHGFTPQLKHLSVTSSSPIHHASSFTKNNLSSVLVMTAPQLRTVDIRGLNSEDSSVVHAMLKHVLNVKLMLHWEILKSLVEHNKNALSPNVATMHVTFGSDAPCVFVLLALWLWATSKCDHWLYCVITKWTDAFRLVLETELDTAIKKRRPVNVRLARLSIELVDVTSNGDIHHSAVQSAWHMFIDQHTRICTNLNTLDLTDIANNELQGMITEIRQSVDVTLRLPWDTLERLVDVDENILTHNVATIHVVFGTPSVVRAPHMDTVVALWKWATTRSGHRLHCLVTNWTSFFMPKQQLEDSLVKRMLLDEHRIPKEDFRCALAEFTLDMHDATFVKMYHNIVLCGWSPFFWDRTMTKVTATIFKY